MLDDIDLDAVTVHQPRGPFRSVGLQCDWAQETETVSIYLAVGNTRARELDVKIRSERLVVARRGTAGGAWLLLLEGPSQLAGSGNGGYFAGPQRQSSPAGGHRSASPGPKMEA